MNKRRKALLFWGGAAATFSPTSVSDMAVWLDATAITGQSDGATLTTWAGSNGMPDATVSGATYKTGIQNSKPVVRFDGTNDYAQIASLALTTALTVYCVSSFTTAKPLNIEHGATIASNNGFQLYGGGGLAWGVRRTSNHQMPGISSWAGSSWRITGFWYDPTLTTATDITGRYLLDGVPQTNSYPGAVSVTDSPKAESTVTTTLNIASRNAASAFGQGDIGELLIFKRALTQAENNQIVGYLAAKWGITLGRHVLLDGDSHTYSAGVSALADTYYQKLVDGFVSDGYTNVFCGAFGNTAGYTLASMVARGSKLIDKHYIAGAAKNIVVLEGGTNDMALGSGVSGATAWSRAVTYCQDRRAQGWKIVLVTALPNENTGVSIDPDYETERQAFNTLMRANWSTYADALADWAADSRIGDALDDRDTTYYNADQAHLNATGNGVVAGITKTAVESLF